MSVRNILQQVQGKMGLNPADAGQRATLVRFLNEAAYEIYNQSDMPGSLMEMVYKINGDQTIAMPSCVGHIRAVREYASMIPWSINQMRPRYNQSNWEDFWRNWRLKNRQPLQSSITNTSQLIFTVPAVDATTTVTVTGRTLVASNATEIVSFSSAPVVSTVNSWLEVYAINKNQVTSYDIAVTDIDGKSMAVIPNNELSSQYQIVDISTMPWLPTSSSSLDHFVEVLYKQKLAYLSNDGDEFPGNNCDIIIANKMCQIWAQEEGKPDLALSYDQLCTRSLARLTEEANRATQDCVGFVVNHHDTLNPRIRPRRPGRYGGYGSTTRYGVV